jgi:hypothetical protein
MSECNWASAGALAQLSYKRNGVIQSSAKVLVKAPGNVKYYAAMQVCRSPLLAALLSAVAWCAPNVRVLTNLPSPQTVGTVVGITAIPKFEGEWLKLIDQLRFRYSVSVDGSRFRVIHDFSKRNAISWRPELYEHNARIKVTVRNVETKQEGEAEIPFRILARVEGQQPVAIPTANPLVALFSAPACAEGGRFGVAFRRHGDAEWSRTGLEPCHGRQSSSMYVAGMRADSTYDLRGDILMRGDWHSGPVVPFRTGIIDGDLAPFQVTTPRNT